MPKVYLDRLKERYGWTGGPVARTALQAMYCASRKLGQEALIRQMNRRFTPRAPDTQKIRTVRDLSKLQAALDEITKANATRAG